jgi:hypothetical protein
MMSMERDLVAAVIVAAALGACSARDTSSDGSGGAANTTPNSTAAVAPAPPKDLLSETSRKHLDIILGWQRDHRPSIGDEPAKAADDTDAGFRKRVREWRSNAERSIAKYTSSMCMSITDIDCPGSPLTKALRAEGFKGAMECGVVDVAEVFNRGEVLCASRTGGKAEFTVLAQKVDGLRKGDVVRFTNLRLGSVSGRQAPLFQFRGDLPLDPPIRFERVPSL